VFRVDVAVALHLDNWTQGGGWPGPVIAHPYYIADDGFLLLTVPLEDFPAERVSVKYTAYGMRESMRIPDWVRGIHTARRLEEQTEIDAAMSMLAVATEAFARERFFQDAPEADQSRAAIAWKRAKRQQRGVPNLLRGWLATATESPDVDEWEANVWDRRNTTFHQERTELALREFRRALDTTLHLVFAVRPSAMLELAGVKANHPEN
jgi:hypothetical protein